MGKKIIHFMTQCDASRVRKSKAEGGGKSKVVELYTPLPLWVLIPLFLTCAHFNRRNQGRFEEDSKDCKIARLQDSRKIPRTLPLDSL